MPQVLSQDVRKRVVAAVDGGMSCRAAAARFGVSASSAIRWRQLVVQHGTPAAKPQGGDRGAVRVDAHAAFIPGAIEAKDDITLAELQALLGERGTPVGSARCGGSSTGTGSRAKKRRLRIYKPTRELAPSV